MSKIPIILVMFCLAYIHGSPVLVRTLFLFCFVLFVFLFYAFVQLSFRRLSVWEDDQPFDYEGSTMPGRLKDTLIKKGVIRDLPEELVFMRKGLDQRR